ncbi:MAG: NADP-dependent oxidoreductase, partial [Gammaproteobacteria bacterium]
MAANRQWRLRRRPRGAVVADDLEWVESTLPPLADGQVRVRNLLLSLDPTNRLWMSEREQYLPPVGLGETMRGGVLGVVEDSRSERFAPGELVMPAMGAWESYTQADAAQLHRVRREPGLPLTAQLSVLGATGVTAYFGMLDIGRPKAGETVVVSAAAGAVGSVAGQIAKLHGCRVIGIAGGPQKCAWLTDALGFDGAIDYKREDPGAALARLCPEGVDVYFENVGGRIFDAVMPHLNRFARVPLCGLIASYNDDGPVPGPAHFDRVLMRRLRIEGFIVLDYLPRFAEAQAALAGWVREGR